MSSASPAGDAPPADAADDAATLSTFNSGGPPFRNYPPSAPSEEEAAKRKKALLAAESRARTFQKKLRDCEYLKVGVMISSLTEEDGETPKRPVTVSGTDSDVGGRFAAWLNENKGERNYCFLEARQWPTGFDFSGKNLTVEPLAANDYQDALLEECKPLCSGPDDDGMCTLNDIHLLLASEMIHAFRNPSTTPSTNKKKRKNSSPDGHPHVRAIPLLQENVEKSIREHGMALTQRVIADNIDFLVLCGDAYHQ